jgi:hypothetical protein
VVDVNVGVGTFNVDDKIKLVSAGGGLTGTFSSFDLSNAFAN